MSRTEVYREQFEKALDRGRSLGFRVPVLGKIATELAFDDPDDHTMLAVVEEVARHFQADDLVAGCLHVSYLIRSIVHDITLAKPMFTVGSVTYLGKTNFEFTDLQLQSWIEHGLPAPAPGVHAWLTMPTMEIVDFTFMYTMKAVVPHVMPQDPIPIFASPDRLEGVTYTPFLVADDFVERVGAIVYGGESPGAGWKTL